VSVATDSVPGVRDAELESDTRSFAIECGSVERKCWCRCCAEVAAEEVEEEDDDEVAAIIRRRPPPPART
jgi:hypothetical protein